MEDSLSNLYLAIKVTDKLKNTSGLSEDFLHKRNILIQEIRRRCASSMNKPIREVSEKTALDWLSNLEMIPLLNKLIQKQLNSFSDGQNNQFIYKNMKPLLEIIRDQLIGLSNEMANQSNNDVKLTVIKEDEINLLIEEILMEMDPTLEWLSIYHKAISEGRILDLNTDRAKIEEILEDRNIESLKTWECLVVKDNLYVITMKTGTILDVFCTIHELAHYFALYNSGMSYNVLDEFPPIFYETYALNYLIKKGYKKEEILYILSVLRIEDIIEKSKDAHSYLDYFITYIENNGITLEQEIEKTRINKEFVMKSLSLEFKNKMRKEFPDFFDDYKMTCRNLNRLIEDLLSKNILENSLFIYIIGYFLASRVSFDEEDLNNMRWITNNLYTLEPYSVFEALGCDIKYFVRDYDDLKRILNNVKDELI